MVVRYVFTEVENVKINSVVQGAFNFSTQEELFLQTAHPQLLLNECRELFPTALSIEALDSSPASVHCQC
jgi:hypothetical protein